MTNSRRSHLDSSIQLRGETVGSTPFTLHFDAVEVMLTPGMLAELARLLGPHLPVAPPPEASPYLTVAEAAVYLRSSRQRVYDLVSSRRLPRRKDGSRVLIRRADLDTYLEQS